MKIIVDNIDVTDRQKNISFSPDEKMHEIVIEDNSIHVSFIANLNAREVFPVYDNWTARTNKYDSVSIVKYINSKKKYGFKAILSPIKK